MARSLLETMWRTAKPRQGISGYISSIYELDDSRQELMDEFFNVWFSIKWLRRSADAWRDIENVSGGTSSVVESHRFGFVTALVAEAIEEFSDNPRLVTANPKFKRTFEQIYAPPVRTLAQLHNLMRLLVSRPLGVDAVNHICHYDGSRDVELADMSYLLAAQKNGRLSVDHLSLMKAFYEQSLNRCQAIARPPMVGAFVMSAPTFEALAHLELNHIRLFIDGQRLWYGLVSRRGHIHVGYWSPEETFVFLAPADRLPMCVFFACLWIDLKTVRYKKSSRRASMRRKAHGVPQRPKDSVVLLPRVIQEIEWVNENRKMFGDESSFSRARNVRAHYRRLLPNQTRSDTAVRNARAAGFPEPPEGYTFVSMYHTGELPPNETDTRLVSTGMDVARVVLD